MVVLLITHTKKNAATGQQPWGVALAQTVFVAESGAAQVLTGACSSELQRTWWERES